MTKMKEIHKHEWYNSYDKIGLVGNLYRYIYPWACECGALKNSDLVVIERN
ncbi:MAG: hypothetical protein AABY07_02390 [Nanoarchaeota archaeon]